MLLADALRRSLAASKLVASQCIVLDVLDDADSARRAAFYDSAGLRALRHQREGADVSYDEGCGDESDLGSQTPPLFTPVDCNRAASLFMSGP